MILGLRSNYKINEPKKNNTEEKKIVPLNIFFTLRDRLIMFDVGRGT